MTAHQVEAEAVNPELVVPVLHALNHELSHHRLLRGRLVAAAGAIAAHSIIVVGIGTLEVGVVNVVGVVVNHVENDSNAGLVEGLHHLLELTDAADGVVGVGGIAPFGHVVVHGVVAPVILRLVKLRLVHRAIVVTRQDVDGIDTQLRQVLDSPRLRQGEELAGKLGILAGNGEVAVVHLVDDEVGWRLDNGMLVAAPVVGECLFLVDDGTALAVDTNGLGKHAWRLAISCVEGIEAAHQVTLDSSRPDVSLAFHANGLHGLPTQSVLVDAHLHRLGGRGGKKLERRLMRRILHFVEVEILCYGNLGHEHR